MHTTKVNDTTFHHNGDYSGNVLIVVDQKQLESSIGNQWFVEIPFETLKQLVMEYFRDKIVGKVEDMSHEELEQRLEQIIL